MKNFFSLISVTSILFMFPNVGNAECKLKISGAASLNQPIAGETLQECHRKVQQAVASQANVFRYCRERFGNKGETLPLLLTVGEAGQLTVGHDCDKIIDRSTTIEEAKSTLKLSECYEERLKKISLGGYRCDCAIPYKWDGTFPLKNSEESTFPPKSSTVQ